MNTPKKWIEVTNSSLIKKFRWEYTDDDVEKLFLAFKEGNTYCYSRVPYEVFLALKKAKSAGKFYNEKIKGIYSSEKIIEQKEKKKNRQKFETGDCVSIISGRYKGYYGEITGVESNADSFGHRRALYFVKTVLRTTPLFSYQLENFRD
jgi:transcription antitermination factor NusG